jgi:hypothetical protein
MASIDSFELSAHFIDHRRVVSASFDGIGWQVETASGPVAVRTVDQAIRVARQQIGEMLRRVNRRPGWGLRVAVGPVAASYGDPDPEATFLPGGRADPSSLVARIYSRWRDGDSALSALDNALEIVGAYAGRPLRRAA